MVILEELAMVEDSPGELAAILADETLWPDQPLGRNIGGEVEIARSLPLSSVERYFRAQYVPSNMVLSVAGNVTHEAVVDAASRWLGPAPEGEPHDGTPRSHAASIRAWPCARRATEQAHLCLTYPALPLGHDDQYAAGLLSALARRGHVEPPLPELREERALVYDVHSYLSEYRDAGAFTVYAGCDPSNARVTLEVARAEVERFLHDVTEEELEKGKRMAAGRIQLRMEDTRAVAAWIGGQELVLEEVLTVDEVVAMIEAVTLDDLRRVGRDLLQAEAATIAAVGAIRGRRGVRRRHLMAGGVLLTVHVAPVLQGQLVAFLLEAPGPGGRWLPLTVLKQGANPYEIASTIIDEWCDGAMSDLRLVDVISREGDDGWELAVVFRGGAHGDAARGSGRAARLRLAGPGGVHGFEAVDLERWLGMAAALAVATPPPSRRPQLVF